MFLIFSALFFFLSLYRNPDQIGRSGLFWGSKFLSVTEDEARSSRKEVKVDAGVTTVVGVRTVDFYRIGGGEEHSDKGKEKIHLKGEKELFKVVKQSSRWRSGSIA